MTPPNSSKSITIEWSDSKPLSTMLLLAAKEQALTPHLILRLLREESNEQAMWGVLAEVVRGLLCDTPYNAVGFYRQGSPAWRLLKLTSKGTA